MTSSISGFNKFWKELKRRHVFRVATVYGITAWLVVEIASVAFEALKIPSWALPFLIVVVGLCFPIALILAWSFEKSPDGFIRTTSLGAEKNPYSASKKKPFTSAITIIVLVLVVLGQHIYFNYWNDDAAEKYSLGDSRIAILPFKNNTNDKGLDVLGDMTADWITQELMSVDEIKVVSFETVKDHTDLGTIGNLGTFAERTGAEKIIKGSYYLQGDDLIFQSQLIDVRSGEIELVLPTISGTKANVEEIVSEISQRLLTRFMTKDSDFDIIKRNPPLYQAYEYYSKGVELFGLDDDECRSLMSKAISLDSTFYLAYSIIIVTYYNQGDQKEADSVFQLSERLVPELSPYAKLWRKFDWSLVYGNMQDTYEAISPIFKKDPRQFKANYVMGLYASLLNRPKEVIDHFSYIDPITVNYQLFVDTWWNHIYAYNLIRLKRYDEAIEILDYVPAKIAGTWYYSTLLIAYVLNENNDLLDPMLKRMETGSFSWEEITYMHFEITIAYLLTENSIEYKKWAERSLKRIENAREEASTIVKASGHYYDGDYEKAIDLYKAVKISETLSILNNSRLGCSYARLGMNEEAYKIIAELESTEQENDAFGQHHLYGQAKIFTALGEKKRAVDILKQAFEVGHGFIWDRYVLDPDFLPLRGYPPFDEFIKPKG